MDGRQFRFASFRLDVCQARLWRDTEEVALPPKVFDLLCYLVRHAGELVNKDQLLDEVWQRRFVSESSLGAVGREGRYHASLVQGERYLLICGRYIEPNPLRANLTQAPADYRWSRYLCHALCQSDPLIEPHEDYLRLERETAERLEAALAVRIAKRKPGPRKREGSLG